MMLLTISSSAMLASWSVRSDNPWRLPNASAMSSTLPISARSLLMLMSTLSIDTRTCWWSGDPITPMVEGRTGRTLERPVDCGVARRWYAAHNCTSARLNASYLDYRPMYRERIFFNRTHDRRQHSSCAELVRALPDGLPVSGERRRLPERRREGLASKLQLFRDIPSDIVEALLQSCPLREFSAETIVLQPGDANENIYVLLAGRLRVHLDASDSANHILIEAGGCIGALSIIDGKPVSAWVVAEGGGRLLIIAQQAFWSRIIPHPGIARNLLRVLTERMRHNNETILQG